jgi:carboxypeptidase Taq
VTLTVAGAAYQELEARFHRLQALREAQGVLGWDQRTMMPPGGAEARGEHIATLRSINHGMLTAPEIGDLLDAAENDNALGDWQRANLCEIRRQWTRATCLPEKLVVALSRARSACEMEWRSARPASDFKAVLPSLSKLLGLVREEAAAKAEALNLSRYDAMLDGYEPDARSEAIDQVFGDIEAFLPEFLGEAMEVQARRGAALNPQGPFPVERQRQLGIQIMETIGFDFSSGRLDESLHPFSGGNPNDARITTRYDEADFATSLMGVLHETGHAQYERGLPKDWRWQPVGRSRSLSIHESQSLLVEMQVCRSESFIRFAAPLIREAFNGAGPAWEADNIYRLYTKVEPGFIRVDADEVTYPAHVILRYNLEKALIEGAMELPDLPAAWNEGMQRLLGITPPSDREGCLQDIHWFDGAWGYFPTYTLGAMTAAQLYAAARVQNPAIEAGICDGDFKPLMAWLLENVHAKGSSISATEIVTQATGKPLDAGVFKNHLRERYLA